MAQYQGHAVNTVPLHHIASADTAGLDADKQLTRAYLGLRRFLYPDIAITVIFGYAHFILYSTTHLGFFNKKQRGKKY
jgi:hypothetical protein